MALIPTTSIELRDGVVRLDPVAAKSYGQLLMPQLRKPTQLIAGDFANQLRKVDIPYRLVTERTAARKAGTRFGVGHACEYCGETVPNIGLTFCDRQCYLRHSVQVRQPIKLAHAKLAEMRAAGLSPGHGGGAAKKRGSKIAESNRRRALGLTHEELRARRAAKARERRERKSKPTT